MADSDDHRNTERVSSLVREVDDLKWSACESRRISACCFM